MMTVNHVDISAPANDDGMIIESEEIAQIFADRANHGHERGRAMSSICGYRAADRASSMMTTAGAEMI